MTRKSKTKTETKTVERRSFLAGAGAAFIDGLHAYGLRVAAYTATGAPEFLFAASLGADAVYIDDVPLGVALQAAQ